MWFDLFNGMVCRGVLLVAWIDPAHAWIKVWWQVGVVKGGIREYAYREGGGRHPPAYRCEPGLERRTKMAPGLSQAEEERKQDEGAVTAEKGQSLGSRLTRPHLALLTQEQGGGPGVGKHDDFTAGAGHEDTIGLTLEPGADQLDQLLVLHPLGNPQNLQILVGCFIVLGKFLRQLNLLCFRAGAHLGELPRWIEKEGDFCGNMIDQFLVLKGDRLVEHL